MGNPETFLKQYKKDKDNYLFYQDQETGLDLFKYRLAEESLKKRMKSYVKKVFETPGPLNKPEKERVPGPQYFFSCLSEELKTDTPLALSLKEFLTTKCSAEPPVFSEKAIELIQTSLEKHKNTPGVTEIFNEIGPVLFPANPDEEMASAGHQLQEFFDAYFTNILKKEDFAKFDDLLNTFPPRPEYVLEEEEYLSDFETEPLHPYHDKIEAVKRENENKNDPELIQALAGADLVINDVRNPDFVNDIAKNVGIATRKEINAPYVNYLNNHPEETFRNSSSQEFDTAGKIEPLFKENTLKGYHPSPLFKSTLLDVIKEGRKNGFFKEDKNAVSPEGRMNNDKLDAIIQPSYLALKAAIDSKNPEEIKKAYKEYNEVTTKCDAMISALKAADPKHLFSPNLTSADKDLPLKYRMDFEGATLFNEAKAVSDICVTYDITPEELLENPVLATGKIYGKAMEDTPLLSVFKTDNPFDLALNGAERIKEASLKYGDIPDKLVNLPNFLALHNPENREQNFHYMYSSNILYGEAFLMNMKNVVEPFTNPEHSYDLTNVLPTMILTGKDYNPFEMLNPDEGIVDMKTMTERPRFRLETYINEHYSATELMDKYKNAIHLYKTQYYESPLHHEIAESVIEAGSTIGRALNERMPGHQALINKIKMHLEGNGTLTPIQLHTAMAELDFYDKNRTAVTPANLQDSLKTLAELKRNYDTHGRLAKAFFPKLHAQKDALDHMINELSEAGMDKDLLEDAILDLSKGRPDKANQLVTDYLNNHEPVLPEEKTEVNALKDKNELNEPNDSIDMTKPFRIPVEIKDGNYEPLKKEENKENPLKKEENKILKNEEHPKENKEEIKNEEPPKENILKEEDKANEIKALDDKKTTLKTGEAMVLPKEPIKQPYEINADEVLDNALDIIDMFDEEDEPVPEKKPEDIQTDNKEEGKSLE